jgi:hypothetical protein
MLESEAQYMIEAGKAQKEINKVAPTHMRRSTKIFFPKVDKKKDIGGL